MTGIREQWESIAARKRATRDVSVSKYKELLAPQDTAIAERIINIDAIDELVEELRVGSISALDVVQAYIYRCCVAQDKTNCLTELHFDHALRRAAELDNVRETTGDIVGPLHGVPISVKDQFDVAGLDTTLGYVGRAYQPATGTAVTVETLVKLGAVVLCKTNIPQSIMWCETNNPLWGRTNHPLNPDFTPGGSSGGEGALLGLRGSLIGLGTDIGGSIRIPAHMNGLWGLKPSSGRLSYRRVPVSTEGQQHVPSTVGPLARSLSSLTQVTRFLIQSEPWRADPACLPILWRANMHDEVLSRPLTVAVVTDDGVVKIHPPVERILATMVARLKEAGHEVVSWDTSLHAECIAVMDAFYSSDGGEDIRRAVETGGEPFIPHVQGLITRGPPITVFEYWQLNKRKIAAQRAYHDQWERFRAPSGRPVDVLLTPTMPHTALPHEGCGWVGYTKVWNVLDYTALSFPAGKADCTADINDDNHLNHYRPRNPPDERNWGNYDSKTMHGHAVGLQLVGRRYEEEKVLGIARVFEQLMS